MAYQGADPSNFTDDEFNAAIELLTQQVDNGQIRQVTGNDYAGALESGDLIAVIGWSGDMIQLGDGLRGRAAGDRRHPLDRQHDDSGAGGPQAQRRARS